MTLIGEYPSDVHLYIPAASRRLFAKFREHLENEGKDLSETIMTLVMGYMRFQEGTDDE